MELYLHRSAGRHRGKLESPSPKVWLFLETEECKKLHLSVVFLLKYDIRAVGGIQLWERGAKYFLSPWGTKEGTFKA